MSTPAGWYPQPDGQQRYWDGQQWTENFAPGVSPGTPEGISSETAPGAACKNWFLRHKVLTAIGAVLLLGIFSSLGSLGTKSEPVAAVATKTVATSQAPNQSAEDIAAAQAADKVAADKAAADKVVADKVAAAKAAADKVAAAKTAAAKAAADKAAAVKAAAGVYDDAYGTFKTIVKSGRGDALIALPKGAKAGLVTATHRGSSNFQVGGLDRGNQSTIDGLVNEIGNYSGTTAYGLMDLGEAPVKLQITADGSWTIKIAPISSARVLPGSISGKGDAVFKFEGDAADFAITHKGSSNFQVQQYGGDLNMGVNEIGKYSGTVPFVAGPTVLVIGADGTWTFKKQG